ncbi:MAG: acyl-CoA dehydrogenase [Myxococcales bacterium]|nr:acyl-CoA dehydrogenase [Myxococcales bacterium]
MSTQAINRFKVDLRELQFVLFEHFKLGDLLGKGRFENWGVDEVKMVMGELARFSRETLGPINAIGDRTGCKIVDGRVITPPGFKEAWDKLFEEGWKTLAAPAEEGGQGAPFALVALSEEMFSGANCAFNMYPGLAYGAAELIHEFGTEGQKKAFLPHIYNGRWAGTMCLTEPQAGSDVGLARSSAVKNPDGTYAIRGTKIFISGGDQDLTENVIHLVLARIEGAPPGTKGLSLFIVPRIRVNDDGGLGELNDVAVASIEHKMGINGSATCVLSFGENGQCVGELVGGVENAGMAQMFRMMNRARIGVGLQGVGIMSTAYLNALEYARDRKQGAHITRWKDPTAPRASILEHADVRRMLLEMKAKVEGTRALVIKLTLHEDLTRSLRGVDDEKAAYHFGQVELLTPLVKSYASDQAFRVAELAVQVYGGAGYTQDYPVEQYCRDAKIFSIYEGTNHIQAMDLVGRKLGQNGGRHTQEFLGDIQSFIDAHREHPTLKDAVRVLAEAHEAVGGTVMRLLGWFQSGQIQLVPLASNRFLEMMSELAVAWLLLQAASVAEAALPGVSADHPDHAFYEGKRHTAIFFAKNILPGVVHKAQVLTEGDTSAIDIPDAAFATV